MNIQSLSEIIELLQQPWAFRALFSSMLVGLMCGLLGCYIVLRNMSMIGDALSHAILPGVVFAFMLFGYNVFGFFLGAVLAGLFTAVSITWIQHNSKTKNDAAIGIVFTAMFSIGVMAISWISQNQGVHLDLKDFLFGSVLGVSNDDLLLTNIINLVIIFSIILFYRHLFATTFQPILAETMGISVTTVHYLLMVLLSFAVVASLQTVGVILVVAMLITPASTAFLLTQKLKTALVLSAVVGMSSALIGLLAAIAFGTTPGPAMAVVAALIYLLAVVFSPQRGMIVRRLRKNRLKDKILFEDVLKQSFKLSQSDELTKHSLTERLGIEHQQLNRQLKALTNMNYLKTSAGKMALTALGVEKANDLVRAHRLWETFLVNEVGLNDRQIHDDAEKYEHLLTKDIIKEVDEKLGFPALDPHGSPIPPDRKSNLLHLFSLEKGAKASISSSQTSQNVRSALWGLNLQPADIITIVDKTDKQMIIATNREELTLSKSFAETVLIDN